MLSHILRKKQWHTALSQAGTSSGLKKTLSAFDLTMLGIGAILGTGIFVLPGIEAAVHAGPGVTLSFALAGVAAACAALTYAELASMVPVAGSSYTYSYLTLGELPAWLVGWNLILEYAVSLAAVATGWSAYVQGLIHNIIGYRLPPYLASCPEQFGGAPGGMIDLPAALIVLFISVLLIFGVKESARINNIMGLVKLAAVMLFLIIATPHVQLETWQPFMPMGFQGVLAAAAVVFFAYIGFDAVSTSSEECKQPQRDLPIGIILSLVACTLLYMAVSAVLTGAVSYTELNTAEPVSYVLSALGYRFGSALVAVGALFGLTSVILSVLYGQSRIFFAMSRDGLIPRQVCTIHPRYGTPYYVTIATGVLVALIAALAPTDKIVEMTNIGTYFAFTCTALGVLILRVTHPHLHRSFRCPWAWIVASSTVGLCCFFASQLSFETWLRFLIWSLAGLSIYWFYGKNNSIEGTATYKDTDGRCY